jgi:DNA-binding MarR family transcriptional regulator
LDESRRTRSKEKRALREDTAGAIIDFEQGRYSAEEYLYLISDLTLKELRVARLLYETRPGSEKGYWEEWKNEVCGDLNIDRDDLAMVLARIEASALTERVIGTKGSKRYIGSTNLGIGYYKVTPAFKKLMNFVKLES